MKLGSAAVGVVGSAGGAVVGTVGGTAATRTTVSEIEVASVGRPRNPFTAVALTSVVIGASSVQQLESNLAAVNAPAFSQGDLLAIDQYAVDGGIDVPTAAAAG